MRKLVSAALVLVGVLLVAAPAAKAEGSGIRVGGGAMYWVALEDIKDAGFDDNGLAWFGSIQLVPSSLLKIEVDVELLPKGYLGSSKSIWAPQAYALLGSFLYGGVGIGILYSDGEFAEDPFFALRAGLDIPLGPIHLDVNANYRFEGKLSVGDIDTNTVFLGAAVRFEL